MKNMVIGSFFNNNVSIFINYEEVELVDSFNYLGSSISSFWDIDHEINFHIGKASAEENLEEPEADPYIKDVVLQNQYTVNIHLWIQDMTADNKPGEKVWCI